MVTVRVSETYDLSTTPDKIGFIGIHTPSVSSITRQWQGLMDNHRYMSIDACDVVLACASVLPADPSQIGEEAGDIAPQDMFNPILYKACSNESFDSIEAIVKNPINAMGGLTMHAMEYTEGGATSIRDPWAIYYGLLSDSEHFKKAMPQQGLEMRGLYPLVFPVLTTAGNAMGPTDMADAQDLVKEDHVQYGSPSGQAVIGRAIRGPGQKMPRLPTKVSTMTNGTELSYCEIPGTYVACIVMPPAKQHKLFYRLKVTWYVSFSELISLPEHHKNLYYLSDFGKTVYGSNYVEPTSNLSNKANMVDADDMDLELVMESSR